MKAELLLKERHQLSKDSFVEIRIWRVPGPLRGSRHSLKYRLAHVVSGICVLRFDNEAGKGDHVHRGTGETLIPSRRIGFWRIFGTRSTREGADMEALT